MSISNRSAMFFNEFKEMIIILNKIGFKDYKLREVMKYKGTLESFDKYLGKFDEIEKIVLEKDCLFDYELRFKNTDIRASILIMKGKIPEVCLRALSPRFTKDHRWAPQKFEEIVDKHLTIEEKKVIYFNIDFCKEYFYGF